MFNLKKVRKLKHQLTEYKVEHYVLNEVIDKLIEDQYFKNVDEICRDDFYKIKKELLDEYRNKYSERMS